MQFWKKAKAKFNGLDKNVSGFSQDVSKNLDRYVFNRLDKFSKVRGFVLVWVALITFLIAGVLVQNYRLNGYYQSERPVAGGLFNEGMVGTFTNANPIYAVQPVDKAVSRLVFAGLVKYDDNNHLIGDLAKSWSTDKSGKVYTVKLRPNLTWQDGQPLTAYDVAFTFRAIQDPAANSPLRPSWTGIKVSTVDKSTVRFELPSPLSPFPHSLTVGIVPEHLLGGIPMVSLRSSDFNTKNPVGAGPFRLQDVSITDSTEQNTAQISFAPFEDYWSGQPALSVYIVHAYGARESMLADFRDDQLNAMAGLTEVPPDIASSSSTKVKSFTLTAANMVFFKTSEGILSDKAIRKSLVLASKPDNIINQLDWDAPLVDEPFVKGSFAYNSKLAQKTNKLGKADELLRKDGWKTHDGGPRKKRGKHLQFNLIAPANLESQMVTAQLSKQWSELGVDLRTQLMPDEIFHKALIEHNYDAVLYGLAIGADPDVFVYWHSSQIDEGSSRLNLSEYDSNSADQSLSAGRTRFGQALRKAKYQEFLEAWRGDVPALGLYQPRFVYVVKGPLHGLKQHVLNSASDRYFSVSNWAIRTAKVTDPDS